MFSAACALALVELTVFVVRARHIRTLSSLDAPVPASWPRVSVIVPARDEADVIGPALRTRLHDDYPDLEIIVVDDRSADGTGDTARAAIDGDPRARVLRIDSLPEGWLGKVHALDVGVREASGEWLLLSDADVHVRPGALKRAVAVAEAQGIDMVALVPEYAARSLPVRVMWTVFLRVMGVMLSPKAISDPDSKQALGSGAFNLVRRSAFDRTPGFEWMRLETADDVTLAIMMKRAGGRIEVMNGRGSAEVEIYRTLSELVTGLEKNGGTTAGHPWAYTGGVALFLLVDWSGFGAVALGAVQGTWWLVGLGAVALGAMTAVHVAALRFNTGTWRAALAWPLGSALFAYGTLRATWLVHHRGGVMWRGTFHPLDEINEARRFEL
jgi:glycosyltransferase involved in cell wall biosynthesis